MNKVNNVKTIWTNNVKTIWKYKVKPIWTDVDPKLIKEADWILIPKNNVERIVIMWLDIMASPIISLPTMAFSLLIGLAVGTKVLIDIVIPTIDWWGNKIVQATGINMDDGLLCLGYDIIVLLSVVGSLGIGIVGTGVGIATIPVWYPLYFGYKVWEGYKKKGIINNIE